MSLTTVDDPAFRALAAELAAHPRQCGYYLVDLVSIRALRRDGLGSEELLERVFSHFDDAEWPPMEQRPDGRWADYAADPAAARAITIDALVGGAGVGHSVDTIPPERAAALWERFQALVPEPRTVYVGMGFGQRRYVFQQGAAIVGAEHAGVLWVVESD